MFSRSVISDSLQPHGLQYSQAFLFFTISQSLLRLMSMESVMPSNHLTLCHPLLQPSIFPSIRVFSSESALHIRWPLSHPYIATGQTIALTRQTFVDKVISLLFNMLSRLVITFLPRSKYFLISWLQSPSAVILEPKKINSVSVYVVSPSICHRVMRPVFIYSASLLISIMYFQISIDFFFNT